MPRKFTDRRPRFAHRRCAILIASIFLSLRLISQGLGDPSDNWTGATNASWGTATNWSTGAAPSSGTLATFSGTIPGSGSTITLSNGETAGSLTFSNSYTLTGGSLALGTGNVNVSGGSTAEIDSLISGGSVATTGTGTLILTNSGNSYTGGTTLNSGATLIVNGDPVEGSGTPLGTGTLTINGGTLGTTLEPLDVGNRSGTTLNNPISVLGDFSFSTNGAPDFTLGGAINLNGVTRTFTGLTNQAQIHFADIGTAGETAGVNFNSPYPSTSSNYIAYIADSNNNNHYTGLTTINKGAFLVLDANNPGATIKGNVDIEGSGVLDYLSGAPDQINNSNATVTVNSQGTTVLNTYFGGMDLYTSSGDTIGTLLGNGVISLGSGFLTVSGGNFSGIIFDGEHSGFSGGGIKKAGAGMLTVSGNNFYTGGTSVTGGTLVVNGTIASSSGVTVSHGAELSGHGSVGKISGAGLVAPGDPQILTATQVDPSGGLSFAFSFTEPGSPTYDNASASGNDVLHITGATPFVFSLTSTNIVTLDFSGATLFANQIYLGGFFTDADIANSILNGADFVYTGLNGAVVQYEGLVQEPSANFTTGTVTNGELMEFKVVSPAPEPSTWAMFSGGVGAFVSFKRRRRGLPG